MKGHGQRSRRQSVLRRLPLLAVAPLLFAAACTSLRQPLPEDPAVGEASVLLQLAEAAAERPARDRAVPKALRRYRAYWQKHQQKTVRPRYDEIVEAGDGDWAVGYRALLPSLYSEEQFRESARILHEGLRRQSGRERRELESALIHHRLARLVFLTLVAERRAEEDERGAAAAEAARRRLNALRSWVESRSRLHPPRRN